MVDGDTVNPEIAKVAFVNVNDKTVEGLRYKKQKHIYSSVPSGSLPGTTGLRQTI